MVFSCFSLKYHFLFPVLLNSSEPSLISFHNTSVLFQSQFTGANELYQVQISVIYCWVMFQKPLLFGHIQKNLKEDCISCNYRSLIFFKARHILVILECDMSAEIWLAWGLN